MNNIDFPIKREQMYMGQIVLFRYRKKEIEKAQKFLEVTHTKEMIERLKATPEKEKHREVIFTNPWSLLSDKFFPIDLNYDTPYYERIKYQTPDEKIIDKLFFSSGYEIKYNDNIKNLDALLNFFGFKKELTKQDYIDCKRTLLNGKFVYDYCELFGFKRKPYLHWENGMLKGDESIGKYEQDSYEYDYSIAVNDLSDYFHLLTRIDPINPEDSFTPFEEEGPIRKRNLN